MALRHENNCSFIENKHTRTHTHTHMKWVKILAEKIKKKMVKKLAENKYELGEN